MARNALGRVEHLDAQTSLLPRRQDYQRWSGSDCAETTEFGYRTRSPRAVFWSVTLALASGRLLLACAGAQATGASFDEQAWSAVRGPDDCAHYLLEYPDGEHAAEARDCLKDEASWGGGADPAAYLREFPAGAHAQEADNKLWAMAEVGGTEESYGAYLANSPSGGYREEAQRRLDRKRAARERAVEEVRARTANAQAAIQSVIATEPAVIARIRDEGPGARLVLSELMPGAFPSQRATVESLPGNRIVLYAESPDDVIAVNFGVGGGLRLPTLSELGDGSVVRFTTTTEWGPVMISPSSPRLSFAVLRGLGAVCLHGSGHVLGPGGAISCVVDCRSPGPGIKLAVVPSLEPAKEDVLLRSTIRRELACSGIFTIVPDDRAPPGLYRFDDAVDVDAWRKTGAEVIVRVTARQTAPGMVEVRGVGYILSQGNDPAYRVTLFVPNSNVEYAAHRIAEEFTRSVRNPSR